MNSRERRARAYQNKLLRRAAEVPTLLVAAAGYSSKVKNERAIWTELVSLKDKQIDLLQCRAQRLEDGIRAARAMIQARTA